MAEILLIATAFIWGIHGLFNPDDNLLLSGAGGLLERTLGTTLCKPLFLCPPCMASFWGIVFGLIYFGFKLKVFLFIICLLGINYAIKKAVYPEYEETSP
jgi:hypothetical protein